MLVLRSNAAVFPAPLHLPGKLPTKIGFSDCPLEKISAQGNQSNELKWVKSMFKIVKTM